MYKNLPAFTILLLLITANGFTATGVAEKYDCLAQNDRLVSPNLPAEQREEHLSEWLSLSQKCPNEPHILHNLGVINAKLAHWDDAATYFKKSLENEPRAHQSYQHLNLIYRHQAVTAYRKALQSSAPAPKNPSFSYQLSTLQNSDKQKTEPVNMAPTEHLQALVEQWLREYRTDKNEVGESTNPEVLLITDTQKPVAIIHTDERSYVLEFSKTQDKWQISEERSVP